jgi:hypothetical protein
MAIGAPPSVLRVGTSGLKIKLRTLPKRNKISGVDHRSGTLGKVMLMEAGVCCGNKNEITGRVNGNRFSAEQLMVFSC